jgi:hypothetical protein
MFESTGRVVFVVMLVPDIASRERESWEDINWRDSNEMTEQFQDAGGALDVVDVLWFPAGGGNL